MVDAGALAATGEAQPRVLVVDYDEELSRAISGKLPGGRWLVRRAASVNDALAELDGTDFDLLVSDLDFTGFEVCRRALATHPDLPVAVSAERTSRDAMTAALGAGACEYLEKPISNAALRPLIHRAIRHASDRHARRVPERNPLPEIIGESASIRSACALAARVAPSDASVLVTGESGTGKELFARAIHRESGRRGAFVPVNCAAVSEQLLESELFGHVRGAFTDAKSSRSGLFVEADGGTLFLDEIGEMPVAMQTKLLRALQERRVRPVGGTHEVAFDARIVTATNKNIEAELKAGRFREDLFYRINVVQIAVPPLRARGDDIRMLAQALPAIRRARAPASGFSPWQVGSSPSSRRIRFPGTCES